MTSPHISYEPMKKKIRTIIIAKLWPMKFAMVTSYDLGSLFPMEMEPNSSNKIAFT